MRIHLSRHRLTPEGLVLVPPAFRGFLLESQMKLKSTYETECYISESGYYVIKQSDPFVSEEMRILLSPQQMQHIINHMTDAVIDSSWWDEQDEA